MDVQPDFKELLALFNSHDVEHVIVGAYALDLLTSITGVSWDELRRGRVSGTFGDVPVHFIGARELRANKRALGRKRDLADLEALGED